MSRRVAIIAFSAPPYSAGGVASAHFNLFQALLKMGLNARLFTFGDSSKTDEERITRRGSSAWLNSFVQKANGLVFSLLSPRKKAYQTRDIFSSAPGSWQMSREISSFNPDVVILSDHGAPGLFMKKGKKTKWILVSHHNPQRFIGPPHFTNFSVLDVHWAIRLENRVLRKVDAVVCPSEYMKVWFKKTYLFSGPTAVIPNLIDNSIESIRPNMDLRHAINLNVGDPLIYMPSAGSRLKGSEYALQVIRCLSNKTEGRLGLYIPGINDPEFQSLLAALPPHIRVYSPGQLPYAEHIANVKACSFGISPSLMENFSMAILESVSSGIPILAFDTGGNAEIIASGVNGYLIPEGKADFLCDKAQQLLNPAYLNQLRESTLKYSREYFDSQTSLNKYLELIKSI